MTEREARKLTAPELSGLLNRLREYISSPAAVIKIGESHVAGEQVHLDGKSFVHGFADFLKEKKLAPDIEISNLSLVMELSTYVRNGGVKALRYRVETTRVILQPDYYDRLSNELCYECVDGEFCSSLRKPSRSLFQRLNEINEDDEALVASSIAEIDELLLELGRRLEIVSLAALTRADAPSEAGN